MKRTTKIKLTKIAGYIELVLGTIVTFGGITLPDFRFVLIGIILLVVSFVCLGTRSL